MSYYVVPMLMFYFGVVLCISYRATSAPVLLTCATPLVLLACLRGNAGTDTAAYYTAFMSLGSGEGYGGEPLFNLIAQALWAVEPDPRFVVNCISLTTAVLMLWALARTRYGAWFGGLLLVPAMFYELTMNVMRFGLASSLFLLATRVPPQQKPVRYFIYAVLGTCTHFSSALMFLFYLVITRRGQTGMLLGCVVAVIGGSFLVPGYLDDKASLYSGLAAPNASSGLMFLMIQMLLLGVMINFRKDFDIPVIGWVICASSAIALLVLTHITYAGIRFQLLLVYLMVVVLLRRYTPTNGRVSNRLAVWLFVIGLIALAGRFHNMLDEEGKGASPFLPYRTIQSLQDF